MQFASDCAMEITNALTDLHLLWDYPVTALSGFSEANILQQGKQISLPQAWSVSIVLMHLFVTLLGDKHLISAKFLLNFPVWNIYEFQACFVSLGNAEFDILFGLFFSDKSTKYLTETGRFSSMENLPWRILRSVLWACRQRDDIWR